MLRFRNRKEEIFLCACKSIGEAKGQYLSALVFSNCTSRQESLSPGQPSLCFRNIPYIMCTPLHPPVAAGSQNEHCTGAESNKRKIVSAKCNLEPLLEGTDAWP